MDVSVLEVTSSADLEARLSADQGTWRVVEMEDALRAKLWAYFIGLRRRQEEKGIHWPDGLDATQLA